MYDTCYTRHTQCEGQLYYTPSVLPFPRATVLNSFCSALHVHNIQVAIDVALVKYDNVPWCLSCNPTETSVPFHDVNSEFYALSGSLSELQIIGRFE